MCPAYLTGSCGLSVQCWHSYAIAKSDSRRNHPVPAILPNGRRRFDPRSSPSAISPVRPIYTLRPSRPSATPFHRRSLLTWRCYAAAGKCSNCRCPNGGVKTRARCGNLAAVYSIIQPVHASLEKNQRCMSAAACFGRHNASRRLAMQKRACTRSRDLHNFRGAM